MIKTILKIALFISICLACYISGYNSNRPNDAAHIALYNAGSTISTQTRIISSLMENLKWKQVECNLLRKELSEMESDLAEICEWAGAVDDERDRLLSQLKQPKFHKSSL